MVMIRAKVEKNEAENRTFQEVCSLNNKPIKRINNQINNNYLCLENCIHSDATYLYITINGRG